MDEQSRKRVDESWKEQVEQEKHATEAPAPASASGQAPGREGGRVPPEAAGPPEARFDLFVSSLAMEGLIALGEVPHPATRKQAANLPHAKYLIDLLGILEEKTKGNLSVEEERLLHDALYQLRMRYLTKAGGS
ncbi:MAG: DUF1844 domain-containing protein [Candidatus Omnitrophota bacterium]|nr:DUF1844 domain-containing protein [Candidatus Omnitrophota bacterium]